MALIPYSSILYAQKSLEKKINQTIKSGEEAYNAGDAAKAIKLFMKAKELSIKANNPEDICLSTYNIGVCYFVISENGEALKNFYEAYTICKKNKLGWHKESNILNGIAGVYFEEKIIKRQEK